MQKLYLKNGRALSRTPGSLLFGDCRCGYCCPWYNVSGSTRRVSGEDPITSSKSGSAQLTYYTYSGGAFVPITISQSGGSSDSGPLVSMRMRTPCGTEDTQGSYSISSAWTGYFGPSSRATIVGVPIGNYTFRLLLGLSGEFYQTESPYTVAIKCDWECSTQDTSWTATGDTCAQIIARTGGITGYSTQPAPGDIPLGSEVTIPEGVLARAPQTLTDTVSATIPAGYPSTKIVNWWFEADFWLDPAYGQGIINP